ncbi:unnamed protein product [Owenia fusiformis]|uniref:Copper transport protein n=1 Tax=Owenia fusiformis TaxID=6347 RepID=A0A8J1UW80_OWEFU|nr:unnamed protein product [Owenia fusiformis]
MESHDHHNVEGNPPNPGSSIHDHSIHDNGNTSSHGHQGHITSHTDDHAGHPSFFNFDTAFTILFKDVEIQDCWGLCAVCFFFFLLTLVFEVSKDFRQMRWYPFDRKSTRIKHHIFQTILYLVHIFIGYSMMFAVMTYNVWLTLSVVIGGGFGYFIHVLSRPLLLKRTYGFIFKSGDIVEVDNEQLSELNPQASDLKSPTKETFISDCPNCERLTTI